MSQLLKGREQLRPILYPQFAEAHLAVVQSPWSWLEVSMSSDLLDWQQVSEAERAVIGGILKGFTLIELGVGCYWRDIVAKNFPHPEIAMMAATFSHQETIHARGYDHLEASLGLDTYEAFKQDPVASKKLGDVLERVYHPGGLGLSLAIFSGAVEGVSLYASFGILLSFLKKSKFKGMGQILSWSVLDENLHSKMGIELYKQLIEEDPLQRPLETEIQKGFDNVVTNELAFIEQAFNGYDLPTISKAEAMDFVKYRANKKLMELDCSPLYNTTRDYLSLKRFFETQIEGKTQNDFFALARNGGGYTAMLKQDFESCDFGF